jgi:hypothetical protein
LGWIIAMDFEKQQNLKEAALHRMRECGADGEEWGFVYNTVGATNYSCCFFDAFSEFDGLIEELLLPWSHEKIDKIRQGKLDLAAEDLKDWQHSRCIYAASNGEESAASVWITPLEIERDIKGYAVFICPHGGAAEDEPALWGVFDTIENALTDLSEVAIVVKAR